MDDSLVDDDPVAESPENPDATLGNPQSPTAADEGLDDSTANWRLPKRDINELRNPLPFVEEMRQKLFTLQDPVDLKEEEFELYWPYIDNVWVRQHKAAVDKTGRSNIDYYACRLQRPTYTPRRASQPRPEGQPQRKKKTREGGTCQVRAKVTRLQGEYKKLTISKIGDHEHTHDLDHLDRIKRNSAVMDIARSEVMKGYMPASVFTVMHEDAQKLAAIGGKHINRNDVRNASQHWRQSFKGELAVHPGYKYDLGNGILSAQAHQNNTTQPQAPPLPPHPTVVAIPADTLYFPPPTAAFLEPYLPPNEPVPNGGYPHVTLSYATSMDSFLAFSPMTPTPISGPVTKAMTHYLRSRHDAIMIGVGTAIADNPTLNCRLAGAGGYGGIGWMHHPRPVIIDPSARWPISTESRVLKAVREGRGQGPWIVVAPGFSIDQSRIEMLKAHGGKYLGLPDFDARYRLSWGSIFRALAEAGIRSIMVEGGGIVINELLRPENVRMINNVIVTVAPTYLGTGGVVVCPNRQLNPLGGPVPAVRFRDVKWQPLGEDVVMCGRINSTSMAPAATHAVATKLGAGPYAIPGQITPQIHQSMMPVRGNGNAQTGNFAVVERSDSVINQLEQAAGLDTVEQ